MTFGTGLLAGALLMFVLASIVLVKFSVAVYDGVTNHANKIRAQLQVAAKFMDDPVGTKAINDALKHLLELEKREEAE